MQVIDDSPGPTAVRRKDDSPQVTETRPRWLRAAAGVGFVFLGLFAIYQAVRLTQLSYSPVPYADMWDELPFIGRTLDGHLALSGWWAQHNEHRIVLSRVQFVVDYGLFAGRGIFLLVMDLLSCLMLALVLTWPIHRVWNDRIVTLGFAAFAGAAILTPAGWENLISPFQVGFIQVYLFAAFAIGALSFSRRSLEAAGPTSAVLGVTIASATAATYSNGNGMLVWAALVFVAAVRRLGRRTIVIVVAVGLFETFAYLWHFKRTTYIPLSDSLARPLDVSQYVLNYLGFAAQPLGIRFAQALGLVAVLILALLVATAVRARGIGDDLQIVVFAAATGSFVLVTALETALSRLNFGVIPGRYSIGASVLWVALMVGVAPLVADSASLVVGVKAPTNATGIAFVGTCAIVAVCAGLVGRPSRAALNDLRAVREGIVASYESGVLDQDFLTRDYAPPIATSDLAWLKRERLGPWSSRELRRITDRGRVNLRGLPSCRGYVDGTDPEGNGQRFRGWVALPSGDASGSYGVVVGPSGGRRGTGFVGIYRPDAESANASDVADSGFVAYVSRKLGTGALVVFTDHGRTPSCALSLPGGS